MRTLILDDDPILVKLHGRLLAKVGLQDVTATTSAHVLIASVREDPHAYDLVLLDLNMPDFDGIEVIRELGALKFAGRLALVSGEETRLIQSATALARRLSMTVVGLLKKPLALIDLKTLVQNAQQALPKQQPSTKAAHRYSSEELAHAIADAELINYYQPKVDIATGEIRGVEALVRWQHPANGMVFPDQFIQLAEAHNLIDALTDAVVKTAFEHQKQWNLAGLDMIVAVNISMDNLRELDFPDRLASLASAYDVQPRSVMLEITESRLMRNQAAVVDILTRVGLKRFGLSIDDFGTGHSSLTQLRELPFAQLKIDRSFLAEAAESRDNLAILENTIALAKQMDLEVVGEGIETLDHWRMLRNFGCDIGQGYYISRPMPVENLRNWMRDWDTRRPEILAQLAETTSA